MILPVVQQDFEENLQADEELVESETEEQSEEEVEPIIEVKQRKKAVRNEIFDIKDEPEPEPVVYFCPKPDSGVNFGKYISRLSFNKAVKFTVSFDIQDGTVANVSFTPEVTKKLNRAVSRYLDDSITPINNVTDCSLPFTIAV